MALKLPDSAVPMGDFPVAKAVDIDFDDGENLQDKFDNGELGGGGNTTDLENASIMYCGIDELNEVKGTNIILADGEDNTKKIMDVLAPHEVFVDWFRNDSGWGRFGINPNLGTRINFLLIQKYNNDNDGVAIAITDMGKVLNRFMRNNILYNWDYDTSVTDVGVTTITSVNSAITGKIEYTVKNGICYVSIKDLISTIENTNLLISNAIPKASIYCTTSAPSVSSSGNLATIYIDKNTTTLRGDFYVKNAKSNCSFSYPVAE